MFWTRLAKLLYDVFNISELACQKEDTQYRKKVFFCIFNLFFPKAHCLSNFLFACLFVFLNLVMKQLWIVFKNTHHLLIRAQLNTAGVDFI